MALRIISGTANPALAAEVAVRVGVPLTPRQLGCFPDGELEVEIGESVRGADVFLFQPTSPPAERHIVELCLLADACRRAGAGRLTAVIPYFGYARQDRRATPRSPIGARVVAAMLEAAGIDRILTLDLHNAAIEGDFLIPLEHVSAVPVLAEAISSDLPADGVIVAPDLGAAKLADRYADLLGMPVAIVHKVRLGCDAVRVRRITGEVAGRTPVVIDDMISTGGTIAAAIAAIREAGGNSGGLVIASHGLFVGDAPKRLAALGLHRLAATDSVAAAPDVPIQRVSIAPLLAEAMGRMHAGRSMADLIARG